MPRLVITENAARGLERCRRVLKDRNPIAMQNAAKSIDQHFTSLESDPKLGRPLESANETIPLRELIIPFGKSGYVALYTYIEESDTVFMLAFRHQKEVGY